MELKAILNGEVFTRIRSYLLSQNKTGKGVYSDVKIRKNQIVAKKRNGNWVYICVYPQGMKSYCERHKIKTESWFF